MANNQFGYVSKLLSKYNFDIDISQNLDLICVICKSILKDPYQSSCGCRYCFVCIKKYLGDDEKCCPRQSEQCSKHLLYLERDLQIDNVANRKISELRVQCPENLCKFTDQLKNIESHIEFHQIKCPYFDMGCNKPIQTMNEHLNIDNFDHTVLLMNYIHNMKNEMTSMKDHYHIVTSELRNEISELKSTNERQAQLLATLEMNCSISKFESKEIVHKIANLKNDMNILKENWKNTSGKDAISNVQRRLDEILSIEDDQNFKIVTLERDQDQVRQQMMGLFQKQGEILLKLGGSVGNECNVKPLNVDSFNACRSIEPDIGSIDSTTLSKELRNVCYAPFRWVVDNFKNHHLAAQKTMKPVMSNCFYSHPGGYKMRLLLYANGLGEGTNEYISLFFHIMRGEFDDRLQWPLKHRVVLSLIDQKIDQPHTKATFEPSTMSDVDQTPFNRPITEMNLGCGKFKFFKLNIAFNNARIVFRNRIILECSLEY